MSIAQQLGQWLGLVMIAALGGYICYRIAWFAGSVRDRFRRWVADGKRPEPTDPSPTWLAIGGRVVRESRDANGVRVIEAIDITEVSLVPPYQMGDLKKYAGTFEPLMVSPPCEPFARRIVTSSRRGGKTEAQRLAGRHPPGEIAVGLVLDLERDILDGDRPSITEPRGIFGRAIADHDAARRERFENGTGQTDWPFP